MATKPGVTIRSKRGLEELNASLLLLAGVEVLVGFPDDGTYRREETGETDAYGKPIISKEAAGITNAALGYIHDNGAPEANVPARPFMEPGIKDGQARITSKLAQTVNAVVVRGAGSIAVEQGLIAVGLIAQSAIRSKINEGIPPPLADSTLRKRAKKGRKGAAIELLSRSKGYEPSMDFAKPLVDTGQLRNAVNFVIRSRKKRR